MTYYGKTNTFDQDSAYCQVCERETELTHNRDESFCSICGEGASNRPCTSEDDHTIEETMTMEKKPIVKHKTEECEHGLFYVSHPCRRCGTLAKPAEKEESDKVMVSIGFGVEIVDAEKWHNQGREIEPTAPTIKPFKVLVCGGRDFAAKEWLFHELTQILNDKTEVRLCHGGARGADKFAGEWAKANGIPEKIFEAKWDQHGKAAGMIRNQQMLDEFKPHLVVAFPGGIGTRGMISKAMRAKVQVMEVRPKIIHPIVQ